MSLKNLVFIENKTLWHYLKVFELWHRIRLCGIVFDVKPIKFLKIMTLIKYNPNAYRPATFTNFVDRFFNDDSFGSKSVSSFSPQVDIAESDKEFELHFHVPGMKKEEIKIDLQDDKLTVSGERKLKEEKSDKNFRSVESFYGSFSRSFYLPDHVNVEEIDAAYTDGVLNIVIPKDEKKETRKSIEIK